MIILADTHIIIWAVTDSPKLSSEAKDILTDKKNKIFYSTVSIWETEIKHMLHPDKVSVDGEALAGFCEETGFVVLPIYNRHAIAIKTLNCQKDAPEHNDPFDRLLLAQAKVEGMRFMTHDKLIPYYNEECILSV